MYNRQQVIEYLKNQTNIFKFDEYIKEDSIKKDNGVVGVITPTQLIMCHTLNNGQEYHNITYDEINKIIYDTDDKKLLNYIRNHQNIYIRVFNEQINPIIGNMKSIWIELPTKVTYSQLEFLKLLEQEYGKILKSISQKQVANSEDALVGFIRIDNKTILDDSFEKVIQYSDNFLLNEKNIIEDKVIIGRTLPNNQKHM